MTSIVELERVAILLLIVVSVVAFVVNRLRIPYSVALVLVGLALTFFQSLHADVTPELILALFIPPVAFEATFHIDLGYLREKVGYILTLAVIGVVLSTLIAGGAVWLLSQQISLAAALVFGALISATDPVAVVALFRSSDAPKRLSVIMEGESLLNDGTAIVVFNIALIAALTGAFNPLDGIIGFVRVSVGGVVVGGILGWIVASLLAHIDDYLVETTMTTCLAFGSYLLAEYVHTSGVLAVVVAGLFCSSLGSKGMSPTTKIVVSNFWEYLAFIANSLVFLLIGATINISQLGTHLAPILVAIAAVLLSRAAVIYLTPLISRHTRKEIPMSWQHVLFWGGLRGAVSLALVLSLPAAVEERDTLRVMTFGVVLFTLLIQATTMPLLMRRLGLVQRSPRRLERDMRLGRLYAAQASWRRLRELHEAGILTGEIWRGLEAQHNAERSRLDQEMHALYLDYGELERELVLAARREALRSERVALSEAMRRGLITDDAFRKLAAEVDQRLEALDLLADLPEDSKPEQ